MPCTSYAPGHSVHYIQAGLTARRPGEIKQIHVLGYEGNWLIYELDGAVHRVWNHDPEVVRELHDRAVAGQSSNTGEIALYFTSVKLLRIGRGGWTVDLYGDPDGPSECLITDHPPLNYI